MIIDFLGSAALFIFGMAEMTSGFRSCMGGRLKSTVIRLEQNIFLSLLVGIMLTAVLQSSSAVTVLTVALVSAGTISFDSAVGLIMGANIGTCATSWLVAFSVSGVGQYAVPISAIIGLALYFKKRGAGTAIFGFAVMMSAVNAMTEIAKTIDFDTLKPFMNSPISGFLTGLTVTAVIQSSSASVGVLQSLSGTGGFTLNIAVPVIIGQNIGTCVTALLSSFKQTKPAKAAALYHLAFNTVGAVAAFAVYPFLPIPDTAASSVSIAFIHTLYNIMSTIINLPLYFLLRRIFYRKRQRKTFLPLPLRAK